MDEPSFATERLKSVIRAKLNYATTIIVIDTLYIL